MGLFFCFACPGRWVAPNSAVVPSLQDFVTTNIVLHHLKMVVTLQLFTTSLHTSVPSKMLIHQTIRKFLYLHTMKSSSYLILFLVIAAISFGGFKLLNNTIEETATETLANINPVPEIVEAEIPKIPANTELPDSLKWLEPSTINALPKKDGHYKVSWKVLGKMKLNEQYNEEMGAYIPYPIFHPTVKDLDQQLIEIKGDVIPIEETGDATILVLSANPYSQCFFCGQAGPETVMDIQLKKKGKKFKTDERLSFRGKLKLNDSDLFYLNYILEDAEVVR